ncbi:MAG TPA: superinfection immunity protein [Aestuariivirga sp.]|nr:superinfection immunity protein [Aestuariivirga sp.]
MGILPGGQGQGSLLETALGATVTLATPAAAQTPNDRGDPILLLVVVTFIVVIYTLPTLVAIVRAHPNRWVIAVINLAFGGTVLGWFGALIWALSAVHRSPTGNHGGESGLNLFVNDPIRVEHVHHYADGDVPSPLTDASLQLHRLKKLRDDGSLVLTEYEALRQAVMRKYGIDG